jgi:hypothetical protein
VLRVTFLARQLARRRGHRTIRGPGNDPRTWSARRIRIGKGPPLMRTARPRFPPAPTASPESGPSAVLRNEPNWTLPLASKADPLSPGHEWLCSKIETSPDKTNLHDHRDGHPTPGKEPGASVPGRYRFAPGFQSKPTTGQRGRKNEPKSGPQVIDETKPILPDLPTAPGLAIGRSIIKPSPVISLAGVAVNRLSARVHRFSVDRPTSDGPDPPDWPHFRPRFGPFGVDFRPIRPRFGLGSGPLRPVKMLRRHHFGDMGEMGPSSDR